MVGGKSSGVLGEFFISLYLIQGKEIIMANELLNVTGMTSRCCTSKIAKALKAIAGVEYVNVSLSEGEASIQYNERKTTPDHMKSAIQAAGYGVANLHMDQMPQAMRGCYSYAP